MPPITPRPPIDRYSFKAQLAKAFSNLESAKAEHAHQSLRLAHAPDDVAVLEQVAALEAEIHNHRLAIRRLEAAQEAASQQESAEEVAARARQVVHLRGTVVDCSDQLEPLLTRLVERLESVGPDLAQFVSLAAQRREAAIAAVRLAAGSKALQTTFANAMQVDSHDVLAAALVGALVRTGIGRVGPSLAPHVVISEPMTVTGMADVERKLQRDRTRLLEALDRAATPQSANTEGNL